MNFSTRFGWSLLLFGAVTVIATFFGYAPRKLANLTPGQIKAAGVVILVIGGVFIAAGADARVRRKLYVGLAVAAGLAVLGLATLFTIGYVVQKRRSAPPPPAVWSQPVPAPPQGQASPGTAVTVSATSAMHDRGEAWARQYGRDKVWGFTVHLAGAEPPSDIDARLGKLVPTGTDGVALARMGGMLQARLAPMDNGERLGAVLGELFPGARVQVFAPGRQVTVFAKPPSAPR